MLGCRVWGLRFRVHGLGFGVKVRGLGFLGYIFPDLGFRGQDSGSRVSE